MLYIRNDTNELVPIDSVAHITRSIGPLTVNHAGQLPAVTVSFNLQPGVALGEAVDAINDCRRGSSAARASPPAFRARPRPSRNRKKALACCW